MAESADYFISHVHYDQDPDHIHSARIWQNVSNQLQPSGVWLRQQVVAVLLQARGVATMREASPNQWVWGERVSIYTLNNQHFIRTDANQREADNLGDLPQF